METFDIIIAGAGISGTLAAKRLANLPSKPKILVIEKNGGPGGRIRTAGATIKDHGNGLHGVSSNLYKFMDQTFKNSEESLDLGELSHHDLSEVGIFSGGKLTDVPLSEMFSPKGLQKIGGRAAKREFEKLEKLFDPESGLEEAQFGKVSKLQKKSPLMSALKYYAYCIGIPDLWSASSVAVAERTHEYSEGMYIGSWEKVFESIYKLEEDTSEDRQIHLKTSCRIVNAEMDEEDLWQIDTEQGSFTGKKLIVAQSPWEAIEWLPKKIWPTHLLNVALKTRPVSIVVLSGKVISKPENMPKTILITAENSQAVISSENEISFISVIDYERSLDAPEVVKAVKALKRAKAKLQNGVEELEIEGSHLALVPVGWAPTSVHSEQRFVASIEKKGITGKNIAFCGDAYGSSSIGDKNLASSVIKACEHVSES